MYIVLRSARSLAFAADADQCGDAAFFQPIQQIIFIRSYNMQNRDMRDHLVSGSAGICPALEPYIQRKASSSTYRAEDHDQHNGEEQREEDGLRAFEDRLERGPANGPHSCPLTVLFIHVQGCNLFNYSMERSNGILAWGIPVITLTFFIVL